MTSAESVSLNRQSSAERALELSQNNILEHLLIEAQIGHELLELPILILQLLQTTKLATPSPANFFFQR